MPTAHWMTAFEAENVANNPAEHALQLFDPLSRPTEAFGVGKRRKHSPIAGKLESFGPSAGSGDFVGGSCFYLALLLMKQPTRCMGAEMVALLKAKDAKMSTFCRLYPQFRAQRTCCYNRIQPLFWPW